MATEIRSRSSRRTKASQSVLTSSTSSLAPAAATLSARREQRATTSKPGTTRNAGTWTIEPQPTPISPTRIAAMRADLDTFVNFVPHVTSCGRARVRADLRRGHRPGHPARARGARPRPLPWSQRRPRRAPSQPLRRAGGRPGPPGRQPHRRPRSPAALAARLLPPSRAARPPRDLRRRPRPRRRLVVGPARPGVAARRGHLLDARQLQGRRGRGRVRGAAEPRRGPARGPHPAGVGPPDGGARGPVPRAVPGRHGHRRPLGPGARVRSPTIGCCTPAASRTCPTTAPGSPCSISRTCHPAVPASTTSLWFHESIRVDDWVLLDLRPVRAAQARGTYIGTLRDRHGNLGAVVGQEMLLRMR